MIKNYPIYRILSLMLLFSIIILFSGCETLKGAANGFKKDWDNFTKWDSEFQEVLW